MPQAEVDIDESLVRRLLGDQNPDLADLELRELGHGWDNVMYRLGEDLTVRLPRRQFAVELLEKEQRWLWILAEGLPVRVPVPLRHGTPTSYFPWPWSIGPWLPGEMAATAEGNQSPELAQDLAEFLAALHQEAPPNAPINPLRGVPLGHRSVRFHEHLAALSGEMSLSHQHQFAALWDDLVESPAWNRPPVWVHGDLHPANLLLERGRLGAVLDFGDLCAGDPATDLAVAWMLFGDAQRSQFREAAGPAAQCPHTWQRALGWALALGVACSANSADNPLIAGIGRRTLGEVLGEA